MPIRDAIDILRRRAWLVVGLPALVALLSWATTPPPAATFQARLAFAVDIPRSARVPGSDDDASTAKIGEALVDDIARIISRDVFADAVAARLPEGLRVGAGEIASELSTDDRHRVAELTVTRAAPPGASAAEIDALAADLEAVALAVIAELEKNGTAWFARLGEDDIRVTVVDRPDVTRLDPPLRARIELPLRIALAILVSLGLAFALHALDPRLYTAAEARAAAGADVVGMLPTGRRLNERHRTPRRT